MVGSRFREQTPRSGSPGQCHRGNCLWGVLASPPRIERCSQAAQLGGSVAGFSPDSGTGGVVECLPGFSIAGYLGPWDTHGDSTGATGPSSAMASQV